MARAVGRNGVSDLLIRALAAFLVLWLLWSSLIQPFVSGWDDDCDCGDH